MSLKAFHIFFIVLSILLAVGFGAWEGKAYLTSGNVSHLIAALLSLVVAAGLAVYGVRFLKKMKNVRLI